MCPTAISLWMLVVLGREMRRQRADRSQGQVIIETARRKSKRNVEHLVASLRPQPAVPSVVRKLPQPISERLPEVVPTSRPNQSLTPQVASSAPTMPEPKPAPALVKPLAAERYEVQFTVTTETFEKLRRVQDLMRHACPTGDIGIVSFSCGA